MDERIGRVEEIKREKIAVENRHYVEKNDAFFENRHIRLILEEERENGVLKELVCFNRRVGPATECRQLSYLFELRGNQEYETFHGFHSRRRRHSVLITPPPLPLLFLLLLLLLLLLLFPFLTRLG